MKASEIFTTLLANLKVGERATTIAARRDEIVKALNKDFRDITGSTANRLMVGSFGRNTAIKGVSDLDLIFIVPADLRSTYSGEGGARKLLNRVRDVLTDRYPSTTIRVDQCVVRVDFSSNAFKFEVQPAFEEDDGSFSYPDTSADALKITKPRDEIDETKACNQRTSNNMRHLARMARAWRDRNGVVMGGLLIDTLVHRFFSQTEDYDSAGASSYGLMARDFFEFLKEEPDKDLYLALGSHQRVKVKQSFQAKAKKAYNKCVAAIADGETAKANDKWREVFGTSVPRASSKSLSAYRDTEQFIEERMPIAIEGAVRIDCKIIRNGWRVNWLREVLRLKQPLSRNVSLEFEVVSCSIAQPYDLKWKVLNRGPEAECRDMIRGQIINSTRPGVRTESSVFMGDHVVECYVIKNGAVVARDRIEVPISSAT